MHAALYTPGLGYYARGDSPFGLMPSDGSDFVTAPELSPLFGRCVAVQVQQALQACESQEVVEFGAGSGALAEQLLETLGSSLGRYTIVEVSAGLQQRQRGRLAALQGPQAPITVSFLVIVRPSVTCRPSESDSTRSRCLVSIPL